MAKWNRARARLLPALCPLEKDPPEIVSHDSRDSRPHISYHIIHIFNFEN
jgi:hypothetical protein